MDVLKRIDPQIYRLIKSEEDRQNECMNFIASENYASKAVMNAQSSVFMNKYAEGYPGKRYYSGCAIVDEVECLAQSRVKTIFKAEYANVQPHSGSQANMAAYAAFAQGGDIILGMNLSMGGHLTHGHPVNFSGIWYKSVQYGVHQETGRIDYEEVKMLAERHRPKIIIAGASSYSRVIDYEKFSSIAKQVGAYLIVDIAHIAGLIAADLHPSPMPFADCVTSTTHKTLRGPRGGFILANAMHESLINKAIIPVLQGGPMMHTIAAKAVCFAEAMTDEFRLYQGRVISNAQSMAQTFSELGYTIVSGGTDNHLFVIDLRNVGLTGLETEKLLQNVGITVSRSCIPYDPEKPWITSGIRIGTPAMTTRGMTAEQGKEIACLMHEIISCHRAQKSTGVVASKIKELDRAL